MRFSPAAIVLLVLIYLIVVYLGLQVLGFNRQGDEELKEPKEPPAEPPQSSPDFRAKPHAKELEEYLTDRSHPRNVD